LIWLKRLLPFVIIGITILGYHLWDRWRTEKEENEQNRVALVTAQVWVATAKYRDDPEAFLAYRDSLLEASGVPGERVMAFLEQHSDVSENMLPFARRVQALVDSLARIEDSLLREAKIQAHDSVQSARRGN
jgi:hypothetical protein